MKNFKLKIYTKLILVEVGIIFLMKFLIPILANYPPLSEISSFQERIESITHNTQYLLLGLVAILLHLIFINKYFKKIFKYINKKSDNTTMEETNNIRKECYVIPQKLMVIQAVLLLIMLAVLFNIVKMSLLLFAKFLLIYFSFFTAAWVISILLIKKDLNQVIDLTFDRFSEYEEPKDTTKFYKTLISNLLPLFLVVIVGVTLFGYASTTTQRGEGVYNYYKQRNEYFKTR